ncbi:MAG: acetyl-CoA carboxylase biotin carboxylase subunit [Pseudomonadota bacterium]
MTISTLLVANRGEIACRVMRTAKAMGIKTVAVYSDADAGAPHVLTADQAVRIGPAPVGESYLRAGAILEAAADTGADAIHPGYGFLSENAGFAEAVAAAGLIFVGPQASAIEVMGDKAGAKRAMIEAGVPCVPGYQGEDQSDETLIREAEGVGFPLMVKAAAGGGGRGMRLVESADALADAIRLARSEAENAFGSGELILERAIIRPRHVEVQVFADAHGGCVHLGERDCSVQRRHQKVIEEAPCPVITPELREEMGAAAVAAARAVDYRGAGTVEFLLDEAGKFYFLEMNTRLQVEHPVTEEVTGLDLVALQLNVAMGRPLGFDQSDVALTGHSIEVRLYAESPEKGFLPSTGPIRVWRQPSGEGVRVDAGISEGGEVSPFYDAMVAKIIATGADRDEARKRLIAALEDTALIGPKTNRAFLVDALRREAFAEGEATTAFIAETYGAKVPAPDPRPEDYALAAVILHQTAHSQSADAALIVASELMGWSSNGGVTSTYRFAGEEPIPVEVRSDGGSGAVVLGDEAWSIAAAEVALGSARVELNGRRIRCAWALSGDDIVLSLPDRDLTLPRLIAGGAGAGAAGGGRVTAPMHGILLDVMVGVGDRVEQGDRVAILEAMKMQHEILATRSGEVVEVAGAAGAQIGAGNLVFEIKGDDD